MPSVTDIHQQTSTIHGKSTPPPPPSSSSSSSTQQATSSNSVSTDGNAVDSLTQTILALEKKQRNLGKRKEKLESYEQEAKKGKELNKDQKEALAKYPEVIGQIECVKDILDQCKKIQADAMKNQKRLSKQIAEEKRLQISQRMIEYAQLRFLLDHRPTTLKEEDSTLFDELSRLIVPTDNSPTNISRSVDAVLAIYHGGPLVPTIKQITGKNPQELREIIERIVKDGQNNSSTTQNEQQSTDEINEHEKHPQERHEQTEEKEQHEEQSREEETEEDSNKTLEQISKEVSSNNVNEDNLTDRNYSDYPLQFDTRNQKIILEQMMENSPFFSDDLNPNSVSEENFLPTNLDEQQQQQEDLTHHPNDSSSTLRSSTEQIHPEQQSNDDQWQQSRSSANHPRNHPSTRTYHSRPSYPHPYHQQQQWRGSSRGGRYNGSYSSTGQSTHQQTGQRLYSDNNSRSRPGSNHNYRGNRGGNSRGTYRGGNSNTHYHGNGNGNGHGYGNSSRPQSYQSNVDQHRSLLQSANSVSS